MESPPSGPAAGPPGPPPVNPRGRAEEERKVGHIRTGRLVFGRGRSGAEKTYEAYNVPYSESKERFNETLEIVRRAWTETNFSHSGEYFQFEDVTVTPRPFQSPMAKCRVSSLFASATYASPTTP